VASLDGSAYVARGSVHNAASIAKTTKLIRTAFERQLAGRGFGLVEILTMCPTGWFLPTADGPEYLMESLGQAYPYGVLKDIDAPKAGGC
jgi:2-oxoglutarate ferredoxin oxidoreductase subunit beta